MSTDLTSIATYVGAFIFVIALIGAGAWILKGMLTNGSNKKTGSFLRGRERRLGVVEAANVDGRRKLILIRRDDTEHLIMTGGPVDVVVETGIQTDRPEEQPKVESVKVEPVAEPAKEPSYSKPERNDDRVGIAHGEHHGSPGQHGQD